MVMERSVFVYKVIFLAFMLLALTMRCAFTLAQESPVSPVQSTAESRFFTVLNDVPLMPGLYEITDESLVFDKLEGRIIQSAAYAEDAAAQEISAFYNKALPQLGWKQIAENAFVREDEKLQMAVDEEGGYNVVHFTVEPR